MAARPQTHSASYGGVTADPERIHELVAEAWLPILVRGTRADTAALDAVRNQFAAELTMEYPEPNLPPLTAEHFRQALSRRRTTAKGGLDGWRTEEAKRLPLAFLEPVACLFSELERGRIQWPTAFLQAISTLIPKPGGSLHALDLRPITLLSVWHATWAGARAKHHRDWALTTLSPSLFGGVPGRSTGDAEYATAVAVEVAKEPDMPGAMGLSIDRTKCFDLCHPLLATGLYLALHGDKGVARALQMFYTNHSRRFRFCNSIGNPFEPTGIVQGCPLSVLLVNCIFYSSLPTVGHLLPSCHGHLFR